jgi:carbon storage regulator CsrA
MLVVTRRPNDRILFPKLGITVHVIRVDGRSVRLGIEAPRSVHVLRHEVANDGRYDEAPEDAIPDSSSRLSHCARNQLQGALLALGLLQRRVELGQVTTTDLESQLASIIAHLEAIETGTHEVPGQMLPALPKTPAAGQRTALVVEDNANERSLLVDYLESCDYRVAVAGDGQDALDYLAQHHKPDVVLLDMNMPRLDGPATVREIRSNPELAGVKVVAVSGLAPQQAAVAVGPAGVDRWFTKPIKPSVLVRELDRELASAGVAS